MRLAARNAGGDAASAGGGSPADCASDGVASVMRAATNNDRRPGQKIVADIKPNLKPPGLALNGLS